MEKFLAHTFGGLLLLATGILTSFLWARVLQDCWKWFVVPWLHLPPMPFWSAIGLMIIASIFTVSLVKTKSAAEGAWWAKTLGELLGSVLGALLTWGVAAIYASFAS